MANYEVRLEKRMGLYYFDTLDADTREVLASQFADVVKDKYVAHVPSSSGGGSTITKFECDDIISHAAFYIDLHFKAKIDTWYSNDTTGGTVDSSSSGFGNSDNLLYIHIRNANSANNVKFVISNEVSNEFLPRFLPHIITTNCDENLEIQYDNLSSYITKLSDLSTLMSNSGLSLALAPSTEIDDLTSTHVSNINAIKIDKIAQINTKLSSLSEYLDINSVDLNQNLRRIISECRSKSQNYEPDIEPLKTSMVDYLSAGIQSYLTSASLDGNSGSRFLDGTYVNMKGCDNKYKVLGSQLVTITELLNTYVYFLEYVDTDGKFLDENGDSLLTEKVIPILDNDGNPVLDLDNNPTYDVDLVPVSMPTIFGLGSMLSLSVG